MKKTILLTAFTLYSVLIFSLTNSLNGIYIKNFEKGTKSSEFKQKLKYPEYKQTKILLQFFSPDTSNKIIPDTSGNPKQEYNTDIESDIVYTIVEVMPQYEGGEKARNRFLAENIVYPQNALKQGIQGNVYVSFIVEADGAISNVKLLRGIGGGCDEEAIRVIGMFPKWKPGMQNGKNVRVLFNVPIYFKLKGRSR